VIEFRWLMSYF